MATIKYHTAGCTILSTTVKAQIIYTSSTYTIGWHGNSSSGWWYAPTTNSYYTSGWALIGAGYYYFNSDGYVDYSYMMEKCGNNLVYYGLGGRVLQRIYPSESANTFSATIFTDYNCSWVHHAVKILQGTTDVTNLYYNDATATISIPSVTTDTDIYAAASLQIQLNDYLDYNGSSGYTIRTKLYNQYSNSLAY